ncbi:hypothetical protein LJ739_06370 [Aestuariibacter halophilus]|uniref:Uncharacterized protein n=1 Tax=Fluctibacter halophilus TaxID=226011 RepID=A0ABS8G5T5_9ALTE|nr:hypothetical protein [Aestuariibacter halophilus]MCC2615859.1 hypothetical protein [Aestuariibacter halophilus]
MYINRRPPLAPFEDVSHVMPLSNGDIDRINAAGGNGWRKVFNVYAKLLHGLAMETQHPRCQSIRRFSAWQQFRDECMLQQGSGCALLFNAPPLQADDGIHLVMGKHYAQACHLPVHWLTPSFAQQPARPLWVTPYFDYRQFTNQDIGWMTKTLVAWLSQPRDHATLAST